MAIQIDGKTPDTIRVGRDDGSLATMGEARVWDGQWRTIYTSWQPRVFTIRAGRDDWNKYGIEGDLSLVESDLDGLGSSIAFIKFNAPVYCDLDTKGTWGKVYPAGTRIPHGETVVPAENYTTHTFTEARA